MTCCQVSKHGVGADETAASRKQILNKFDVCFDYFSIINQLQPMFLIGSVCGVDSWKVITNKTLNLCEI